MPTQPNAPAVAGNAESLTGPTDETFRALVATQADGRIDLTLEQWTLERLMPGDLVVRVAYSTINYKDGLVARAGNRVARRYPLIPGVDLAGVVVESADARYRPGDRVIAFGFGLGTDHHGGFAEMARIPADWALPLPPGLTTRAAMALGTAGVTSALSVVRLEHNGLRPERGPVVVTGASGGVGSTAVAMLAARGYEVVASTGSADAHAYLRELGATGVVGRFDASAPDAKPLGPQEWAGAVDPVGGATLAHLISRMKYGGSIALSGLVGGAELHSTVYPFILRGVNLLGIDAVSLPPDERREIWHRLASDLYPSDLEASIAQEVGLDEVPALLPRIVRGDVRGRVVVRLLGEQADPSAAAQDRGATRRGRG